MTRAERAKAYFKEGYACSQAVALAFTDLTDMTEEQVKKATLGFGGGFGRLRLVCGAVCGMTMMAGLILSKDENTIDNKLNTYAVIRELCEKFSKETGSVICAELLAAANLQVQVGGNPEKRSAEYYKKRPCDELVHLAAEILENYLIEKEII